MITVSALSKNGIQRAGDIIFFHTLLIICLCSCSPEPVPINYNHDQCEFCKMIISDVKYGAEIVTGKGKVYKFDSIECMPAFIAQTEFAETDIHSYWVVDFNNPQVLINAQEALYLRSENLRSPMGLNLSASKSREAAEILRNRYKGEIVSWEQVQKIVQEIWIGNRE